MKWKTTQSKSHQDSPNNSWEVIVSDSLRTQTLVRDEHFDLTLLRSYSENSPASKHTNGPVAANLKCEIVGDGKSLKIGHQIVRLVRRPTPVKKGSLRFRVNLGGLVQEKTRTLTPVRPVEPHKGNATQVSGDIKAPITGKVVSIRVREGQIVEDDEILLIIEAMKMENQIRSECSGTIAEIKVKSGQAVSIEDLLIRIKTSEK